MMETAMAKAFRFSDEAEIEVGKLTSRCRLSSDRHTVRLALSNLREHLDIVDREATIVVREKDGTEQPWHPLLEPTS